MNVAVVADSIDAALAGHEGGPPSETIVALGDVALPERVEPDRVVRWLRGRIRPRPDGARVIAQTGGPAWRLAPWPAADALFELPLSPDAPALVIDDPPGSSEPVVQGLTERGLDFRVAERLTREELAAASVVVYGTRAGEPLPAEAPAVLAARRILVTGPCQPAFGLTPEVDWFPADHPNELAQYADSALRRPSAFRTPRAMGAIAAERHRASVVYERLSIDLELEGALSG